MMYPTVTGRMSLQNEKFSKIEKRTWQILAGITTTPHTMDTLTTILHTMDLAT